ncbi:MAG: hypothetical protein AAFQ57_12890, partial [Cyanobacteria bacterium J06626_14]
SGQRGRSSNSDDQANDAAMSAHPPHQADSPIDSNPQLDSRIEDSAPYEASDIIGDDIADGEIFDLVQSIHASAQPAQASRHPASSFDTSVDTANTTNEGLGEVLFSSSDPVFQETNASQLSSRMPLQAAISKPLDVSQPLGTDFRSLNSEAAASHNLMDDNITDNLGAVDLSDLSGDRTQEQSFVSEELTSSIDKFTANDPAQSPPIRSGGDRSASLIQRREITAPDIQVDRQLKAADVTPSFIEERTSSFTSDTDGASSSTNEQVSNLTSDFASVPIQRTVNPSSYQTNDLLASDPDIQISSTLTTDSTESYSTDSSGNVPLVSKKQLTDTTTKATSVSDSFSSDSFNPSPSSLSDSLEPSSSLRVHSADHSIGHSHGGSNSDDGGSSELEPPIPVIRVPAIQRQAIADSMRRDAYAANSRSAHSDRFHSSEHHQPIQRSLTNPLTNDFGATEANTSQIERQAPNELQKRENHALEVLTQMVEREEKKEEEADGTYLELLAREIYGHMRQRLMVERERRQGGYYQGRLPW